jgi:hypothetical protein
MARVKLFGVVFGCILFTFAVCGQPQTELPVEDTTLGRCFVAIGSRWRTLWYGLEAKD